MNKASSLLAKPIQENHKMDKTNTYKSYLDEYMAFGPFIVLATITAIFVSSDVLYVFLYKVFTLGLF